jgi:hypothetical protein
MSVISSGATFDYRFSARPTNLAFAMLRRNVVGLKIALPADDFNPQFLIRLYRLQEPLDG